MRFKCRLINLDLFLRYCAAVMKLSKKCTVLLNPEKINMIVASETSDGMQLWSGVPAATLFEGYLVESLNNNQVAFELQLENLSGALKSAQFSTDCLCKLTKKNGHTFLTFIVEIQAAQVMSVVQDVPIRLLSPTQTALLVEPHLPDPTVHILLPALKALKPIVERLKKLDEVLTVECNMDGVLKLGVQTDAARVVTIITGLEHPKVEGADQPPARDADLWGCVRVDMKKFSRFLGAHVVNPAAVVCCVIVHKALVMHVILDNFYLTYYIPVMQ